MAREPMTTGEIADYCHVTYRAVLKWITSGKLKAYRTPGKHSRVRVEDFLAFLKTYHMPVPADLQAYSQKQKVLIADDDPAVVNLMRSALREEKDLEIRSAGDGFTAGQMFCNFQPQTVILDINMPGLDGYQVCEKIRANPKNAGVKILVVSGMIAKIEDAEKALKSGADAIMSKPFDVEEFTAKVRQLLGRGPEGG